MCRSCVFQSLFTLFSQGSFAIKCIVYHQFHSLRALSALFASYRQCLSLYCHHHGSKVLYGCVSKPLRLCAFEYAVSSAGDAQQLHTSQTAVKRPRQADERGQARTTVPPALCSSALAAQKRSPPAPLTHNQSIVRAGGGRRLSLERYQPAHCQSEAGGRSSPMGHRVLDCSVRLHL